MLRVFTALAGVVAAVVTASTTPVQRPNVVFILTDDQDQMLGSSFPAVPGISGTPLPKTQSLLVDQGAVFSNFFTHVPICNPSRSSTLTGRYFHNLRTTGTPWAAMHVDVSKVHNASFAVGLQKLGYRTGLFGKYLNAMPDGFVPRGWDAFLANDGGDYVAPAFVVGGASYSFRGVSRGATWTGDSSDYTTAVVGNASIAWILNNHKQNNETTIETQKKPFFAYVAPKAAHEPFDPAPWYRDAWDDEWSPTERRGPAWNASFSVRARHGANVPTQPLMTEDAAVVVSGIWRNRWRTLMSVDDAIASLHAACDPENTYFFYTSDHGFQLGHFNMLMDKRHVYDWNTRVHLVVKGPGIAPGRVVDALATNVDLAPTFLDLATGGSSRGAWYDDDDSASPPFDGRSLAPLVLSRDDDDDDPKGRAFERRRTSVPIEYYYNDNNTKCVGNCTAVQDNQYPSADASCADLSVTPNDACWGAGCDQDCYPTESLANNFIGLRRIDASSDLLYVLYETGNQTAENLTFVNATFVELFDAAQDPWMLDNVADNVSDLVRNALHADLMAWFHCAGSTCP